MKKRTFRTTGIAVIAVILGALLINSFFKAAVPPKEFLEARIRAIAAANNLSQLVNNSIANLEKVDRFVSNENDVEAQALIAFEFAQKTEKQNAAVVLATRLDEMAKTIPAISSGSARAKATQGVTSGISMVSRMVSYNSNLDQLFNAIQYKIANHTFPPEVNARAIASNLNSDAQAINALSKEFNAALDGFDQEYGVN